MKYTVYFTTNKYDGIIEWKTFENCVGYNVTEHGLTIIGIGDKVIAHFSAYLYIETA